jgi:hypothetical protein
MPNEKDKSNEPASSLGGEGPGNPVIAPPVVTAPSNGALVGRLFTVTGTGHKGRNVRVVSPGQENFLSAEKQLTGTTFQLPFLQALNPGRTDYQILQWLMMPNSHARSPVMHVFYLPKVIISSPRPGSIIGVKPTVSGDQGAPGATVELVQAGSGAVIYGTATVAYDGKWSASLTIELPKGTFIFTARQHLGGHYSEWSENVPVTVS